MRGSRFPTAARALAAAGASVALIAASLALAGPGAALGQETADCEVVDLGTLGSSTDSVLEAQGRWTTEDCDSRFRLNADAHTYRFEVAEAGRVRIDLSSAEADAYLYLLAEDGRRIGFNDDGGISLAARIETDLAPGSYLIEATTSTGRDRGPADFTLTVGRVVGCDPILLGALEPGADLTATGSWTRQTCGSRIEAEHPAATYVFELAESARVRIDLESEVGDTVLSVASLSRGVIGANDDGGEGRNSRIDKLLAADIYFIEATTYWTRDFHALEAEYTLTIHLVDEHADQQAHKLKIEAVHIPSEVVAGDRFDVHYRVGNLGGELPSGAYARTYVISRGVYEYSPRIRGIWHPGASYHTGDETASAVSTKIDEIAPVEISVDEAGLAAVNVFVLTWSRDFTEIGYRFFAQPLKVLSGPVFGPVNVRVHDKIYTVTAEADEEGQVTTSVHPAEDPDAEISPGARAQAIYTAGVLTQLLDGLFERPVIAGLSESANEDAAPSPVDLADLSSSALLNAFAQQYMDALGGLGVTGAVAAGEAITTTETDIEEPILAAAGTASSQYAFLAASWRALLDRIESGTRLSFEDALRAQAEIAYAESIIDAAVAAGRIVDAARAADKGWDDPDVRSMMREADCSPGAAARRDALEAAGTADIEALLAVDAELRSRLPMHGIAADSALCALEAVEAANLRFLERLSISRNAELLRLTGLVEPAAPDPVPEPHRVRIIARLGDDFRIEHGIELADGEQILPPERFLRIHGVVGRWQTTGDVEVDGSPIGTIRGRRLGAGRFEIGFVGADGEAITPGLRYLPANLPEGVWFRSSEISVPASP